MREKKMPFCSACGFKYEIGREACPSCGLAFDQIMQPISTAQDEVPAKGKPSVKTRRALAGAIDILLVVGLIALLFSPRLGMLGFRGRITAIVSLLLPFLYLFFKDCIDGKSIGKLFMGITAVNVVERKTVGILDSFLRNVVLIFPIVWPVLAAQILLKNSRWGDRMANTAVIYDRDMEQL
jgi:uncharacterized RDD family membrane protein YckC